MQLSSLFVAAALAAMVIAVPANVQIESLNRRTPAEKTEDVKEAKDEKLFPGNIQRGFPSRNMGFGRGSWNSVSFTGQFKGYSVDNFQYIQSNGFPYFPPQITGMFNSGFQSVSTLAQGWSFFGNILSNFYQPFAPNVGCGLNILVPQITNILQSFISLAGGFGQFGGVGWNGISQFGPSINGVFAYFLQIFRLIEQQYTWPAFIKACPLWPQFQLAWSSFFGVAQSWGPSFFQMGLGYGLRWDQFNTFGLSVPRVGF